MSQDFCKDKTVTLNCFAHLQTNKKRREKKNLCYVLLLIGEWASGTYFQLRDCASGNLLFIWGVGSLENQVPMHRHHWCKFKPRRKGCESQLCIPLTKGPENKYGSSDANLGSTATLLKSHAFPIKSSIILNWRIPGNGPQQLCLLLYSS